ncbi:hypothetical protein [Rickettsiella endosymbiont of Miltochrista miniata]|uniref:hypothetical protein n=1 Tax=Rickettsiella endosymbiont of Miltochrista miniata TaxID=3066239 RepID=UPI00313E9C38
MKSEEQELQKKYLDYQHCQIDVLRVKEGIKKTEDIWNKYSAHIGNLIASAKIKDQDIDAINGRIEVLNEHWKKFKAAWEFTLPKPNDRDYDPFDPNPNQQYSVGKLIPKSTQKQEFDCFAKRITELHDKIQELAYSCWFDRLYQFIKTNLLRLYNCLYAGPGNLSAENVYLVAAHHGQAAMMPCHRPKKHNYFICQEKLSDNTALLQEDLAVIKNWQNASRLDCPSLKR